MGPLATDGSREIVWVTGAGRGIGAAAAAHFARLGARVALSSRTLSELESTRQAIETEQGLKPGQLISVACDVSDEASVKAAYQVIVTRLGTPTTLIANAGSVVNKPFIELALLEWNQVLSTNLTGSFLCAREFLRGYQAAGLKQGSITFVTSLGGLHRTLKFPGLSAYTAAKCGVTGLMEAVAVETKPLGVRVNAVAPGAVETRMLKEAAPFLKSKTTTDDVAEVIVYLADSVRARAVHGTVVEIHSNET